MEETQSSTIAIVRSFFTIYNKLFCTKPPINFFGSRSVGLPEASTFFRQHAADIDKSMATGGLQLKLKSPFVPKHLVEKLFSL